MRLSPFATAALAGGLLLSGCGTVELFGTYDVPESPDVETTPYPRLVDVPEAPPPGTYTAEVPDPAEGVAITVDLGAAAAAQNTAAERINEPVLSEADRRRLSQ